METRAETQKIVHLNESSSKQNKGKTKCALLLPFERHHKRHTEELTKTRNIAKGNNPPNSLHVPLPLLSQTKGERKRSKSTRSQNNL